MALRNPLLEFPLRETFESLLPDFVLAFAFFTALVYAVLSRRFERQRPAVAMSSALGLALSIGLVWWEQRVGLSIRDLGPFAVGLAIIILAAVMYQAIRQVGGTWAGIGIALGATLLISALLGMDWPVTSEILQTVTTVALIVGILAFLIHYRGHFAYAALPRADTRRIRHDMRDLYRDHLMSHRLHRGFKGLKRQADILHEHPQDAQNVLLQIKRMLPAEGWLTERLAELRAKAYRARQGHVVRIEEIQHLLKDLPPEAKKQAGVELKDAYKELNLDLRLERLDKAVAENERRIRELTKAAEEYTARHEHRKLHQVLEEAEQLQKHNSRLFKTIERTEEKLQKAAKRAAEDARGVTDA